MWFGRLFAPFLREREDDMEQFEPGMIPPAAAALQKLRTARSAPCAAYVYGATGYGKTALVRHYLAKRRYGQRFYTLP